MHFTDLSSTTEMHSSTTFRLVALIPAMLFHPILVAVAYSQSLAIAWRQLVEHRIPLRETSSVRRTWEPYLTDNPVLGERYVSPAVMAQQSIKS